MRNFFSRFNSSRSSGFSIIELLIVIALIGILAGAMVTVINPISQLQKSRDGVRKSDLRQIQAALELYRADIGAYPSGNPFASCSNSFAQGGITYMQKIPCDPSASSGYIYTGQTDVYVGGSATPIGKATYTLTSCLENANDPQKDSTNTCSGSTVSYTLRNP